MLPCPASKRQEPVGVCISAPKVAGCHSLAAFASYFYYLDNSLHLRSPFLHSPGNTPPVMASTLPLHKRVIARPQVKRCLPAPKHFLSPFRRRLLWPCNSEVCKPQRRTLTRGAPTLLMSMMQMLIVTSLGAMMQMSMATSLVSMMSTSTSLVVAR